ncbi:MAG TPA: E2/UBC family protein [Thermoplasmata archaeon]|nr:E2/UBC family protein [Thermoplasmata archaeon]
MLPAQLSEELTELKKTYRVEVAEEDTTINVVIFDFPTSTLYNLSHTRVLIRVPRTYPDAGLDMFWTDPDLKLADGSTPNGADQLEPYPATGQIPELAGKAWRRFSWHPQPGTPTRWNPAYDNLLSYTEFIKRRLSQR